MKKTAGDKYITIIDTFSKGYTGTKKMIHCEECGQDKFQRIYYYPNDLPEYTICMDCFDKIREVEKELIIKQMRQETDNLDSERERILKSYGFLLRKDEIKNKNEIVMDQSIKQEGEDSKPIIKKTKNLSYTDFLTITSVRKCIYASHTIEDIIVMVHVFDSKDYSVKLMESPAIYCVHCDKYYILESDYQRLNSAGIILCNVVDQEYWITNNTDTREIMMNPESVLHKMGYNVNANDNIPRNIRRKILQAAVDNRILTKAEILSHLDYLIRRSLGRKSFAQAISRWSEDREYVQEYCFQHSIKEYTARSIVHRTTRTRRKRKKHS